MMRYPDSKFTSQTAKRLFLKSFILSLGTAMFALPVLADDTSQNESPSLQDILRQESYDKSYTSWNKFADENYNSGTEQSIFVDLSDSKISDSEGNPVKTASIKYNAGIMIYDGLFENIVLSTDKDDPLSSDNAKIATLILNGRNYMTIIDSSFKNITYKGDESMDHGVIYNQGVLNFIASLKDIVFEDNGIYDIVNRVYPNVATTDESKYGHHWGEINLNAAEGRTIVFNGNIGKEYFIEREIKEKEGETDLKWTHAAIAINPDVVYTKYSSKNGVGALDLAARGENLGTVIFNGDVETGIMQIFGGKVYTNANTNVEYAYINHVGNGKLYDYSYVNPERPYAFDISNGATLFNGSKGNITIDVHGRYQGNPDANEEKLGPNSVLDVAFRNAGVINNEGTITIASTPAPETIDGKYSKNGGEYTMRDGKDIKLPSVQGIGEYLYNTSTGVINNSGRIETGIKNEGVINNKSGGVLTKAPEYTGDDAAENTFDPDEDNENFINGYILNMAGGKIYNDGKIENGIINHGYIFTSKDINGEVINKSGSTVDIGSNAVTFDSATFEKDSTLKLLINIIPRSSYGLLNTTGLLTINEGAIITPTVAQGVLNKGDTARMTLLSSDEKFTDNFTVTKNNMYDIKKVEGEPGVYEIVATSTAGEVVAGSGGSGTSSTVADAWIGGSRFSNNPALQEIADELAALAQHNAPALLNELAVLAPVDAPMVQEQSLSLNNRLMSTVVDHLSSDFNKNTGIISVDDPLGINLWAKTYYGESKLSDDGSVKGFDTQSNGVIVGIDKKIDSATKVGLGYQHDETDISGFHRKNDVSTNAVFVYGEYSPSEWFVSGVASFDKSDYDETKIFLGNRYNHDYSAYTYSVQALTGYRFDHITPELGLNYHHIRRESYTDSLAQNVSAASMDIWTVTAGTKVHTEVEAGSWKLRPEAYVGVTYDLVSDGDDSYVTLANGSGYNVNGKTMNRFGIETGAELTAEITDNMEISLGYTGNFRHGYQNHTGLLSFSYSF